ncbi:hypothetical protein EDD86DRAFT_214001 [Gorgonomyces haynaldii]|nr:hypothetical protein EDD86DRAFT_214001 [Gorgonomyces haynaldii]
MSKILNRLEFKRLLDLGVGLGLQTVVASKRGQVTGIDFVQESVDYTLENLKRNNASAQVIKFNWHSQEYPFDGFDVIAGSDVLYMRNSHRSIQRLMDICLVGDGICIFTDPGRGTHNEFIELLEWETQLIELVDLETPLGPLPKCIIVLASRSKDRLESVTTVIKAMF